MWFISWVSLTTGFFSHGQPVFKTYQECLTACGQANIEYPEIKHAPMHDLKLADKFEQEHK